MDQLIKILEALNIPEEDKRLIFHEIKALKKSTAVIEFKYNRTLVDKAAITNVLNASIGEIESQKKIIENAKNIIEAQNRDLEIETSLERVRSVAMSMRKANDMLEVCRIISDQLETLHAGKIRSVQTAIVNENKGTYLSFEYYGLSGKTFINEVDYNHPLQTDFVNQILNDAEAFFTTSIAGAQLKDWLEHQNQFADAYPEEATSLNYYWHSIGPAALGISTYAPLNDGELTVFKRFRNVFDLAYRRFRDIQQAEVQAREAIKTSSLDRVRAEIASMRTIDDLQRITPIVWHELTTLGVPFVRCGVYIIDETNANAHVYLSAPDGHSLAVLNLPINSSSLTMNSVDHWRKGIVYTEHWNKEEFIRWTQSMIEQGQVSNRETYQGAAKPPESLDLHFVPFTQGMLYVGNTNPLTQDELDLVKSLAESFSIAYARYEDFRKLEDAKSTVEITLNELKATQSQLIQSEKMASLGELTAGIAHEIQNPLNFVNNFSEVNIELMDEMEEEINKGNLVETKVIAKGIRENERKIHHHGKRADAIVKSMLQHSRSSSGLKEPVNINALADEYLRLAYHGLKAKENSFKVTIKTAFDESISNINIISQDIGRVLLNLYNNAFFAVTEKKEQLTDVYEPTVSVSTKRAGDKVEIRVRDNGGGVPQKVLDKIFNPFFTTKPTGQGTGLGLSLSYDIIKAHGGEIKVDTKEGEGAEFIISLPA